MGASKEARSNRLLLWLFLGGLIGITLYRFWIGPTTAPPAATYLSGETMGTTYNVKLATALGSSDEASLRASIESVLSTIIGQMSTYEPDSEISRFNQSRSTEPFPVSKATAQVVAESLEISRQSDGAFDVTVQPLVDAWGFGPSGRPEAPPSDGELDALKQHIGYDKLEVSLEPPTLTKHHPEVEVDLSAIAKGYAVDRLAELVESLEVTGYMIEIGGDVRARGENPRGGPWRLGIEEPVRDARRVRAIVGLEDAALATSGNYRNSYEVGGVRYVHTLDPSTARPVRHRLAGVSVIHPRCAVADAWATALMVLGPERASELIEARGLQTYLIISTDGGFEDQIAKGFDERLLVRHR